MRYMIDIETLGTGPQAPIIQIGVARFDNIAVLASKCWDVVPLADSVYDYDTVRWWMDQVGRGTPFPGVGVPLETVLVEHLPTFMRDPGEVWAHPPTFDLTILQSAYQRLGHDCPWSWTVQRDTKTLRLACKLVGLQVERPRAETAHDARSDAIAQAEWVIAMKRGLKDVAGGTGARGPVDPGADREPDLEEAAGDRPRLD